MLTGFNTDIKYAERVYHVQTEDRGLGNPVVESLVYVGGEILLSKKSPYTQHITGDRVDEKAVRELMDQQHRRVIEAIRRGRLDKKIPPEAALDWADDGLPTVPGVSPAAIAAVAAMLSAPSEPLPGDRPRGAPRRSENVPEAQKKGVAPPPGASPATPSPAKPASSPGIPSSAPTKSRPATPAGVPSRVSASSPTPNPFPSAIAPAVRSSVSAPAPGPAPRKTPAVTSGARTLDQVIVEYLASEAATEHLELSVTLGGEFVSGQSVPVSVATTTSLTRRPVAGAQITIRVVATSRPPEVLFRGVTGNDGFAKVTCAIPDIASGNAAVIVSASSTAGSSEIKYLVRKKAR